MLAAISTALCFPYIAGITFLLPSDYLKMPPGPIPKSSQSKDVRNIENLASSRHMETLDKETNVDKESIGMREKNCNRYFSSVAVWKGLGLMFFYQFAGYNVVSFYATSILNRPVETQGELLHPQVNNNFLEPVDTFMIKEEALEEVVSEPVLDFKLDPVLGTAVLVAMAGLVGVITGVILVKWGINRKRLLLFSGIGTAIAFLILGIYFHYDSTGCTLLVPTLSLTSHILIFNLGFGSLGYPAITEMLPPNIRLKGLTLIQICGGIFAFANSKSFGDLDIQYGPTVTFVVYGVVNIIGACYMYKTLPKGLML